MGFNMKQETKEDIKMRIIVIVVILAFVAVVVWFQSHFYSNKELKEVIESAYSDGFDTALSRYGYYEEGYEEGYDSGFEDGEYDGYRDGYKDGHVDGFGTGYEIGYEDALAGREFCEDQPEAYVEP